MSAQANLKRKDIETVVLSGFLTNCCVESTMRMAYEKGTDAASSIPQAPSPRRATAQVSTPSR